MKTDVFEELERQRLDELDRVAILFFNLEVNVHAWAVLLKALPDDCKLVGAQSFHGQRVGTSLFLRSRSFKKTPPHIEAPECFVKWTAFDQGGFSVEIEGLPIERGAANDEV